MAGGAAGPMADGVATAISRLPEAQKLVMAAIYYEGASTAALAEALGLTSDEVEALHERGVLGVAEMLGVEPAIQRDEPDVASKTETGSRACRSGATALVGREDDGVRVASDLVRLTE